MEYNGSCILQEGQSYIWCDKVVFSDLAMKLKGLPRSPQAQFLKLGTEWKHTHATTQTRFAPFIFQEFFIGDT